MKDLRGKVVAITGAAGGIGRAAAEAFAARGARLALADIDGEALGTAARALQAGGAAVEARRADVAVAADVEAFRDAALEAFGRVDVLVNNAGIAVNGFLEDMALGDWERLLGVDLWGVIHGCHFFYPGMAARGAGHIVNVASMAGLVPLPASAAYCAAKSAVVGLSAALRLDAARHGVGVSVVCPGVVSTGMGRALSFVSRTRRLEATELKSRIGAMMTRLGHRPQGVAEAIVRAVRTDAGVAAVGAEALALDLLRRAHRGAYDAATAGLLRFLLARA
jgi:NAD(P)-dependent dehydrogenase (short-subunit alcohol dehydrogenase family)